MKPLNYDDSGCNPISSNCVLWQGPDIECIDLCKGDTVSEVVYKLATELCTLLDTFSVDAYDLSCLELAECEPETFTQLIQLLIDRICECCNPVPDDCVEGSTGCPDDCIVNICEDFYYTNPQGDEVQTMTLKDYVVAIGNKVCQLIDQIATINDTLDNHEDRITILEEAEPPTYTPPQITPVCVIDPSVPTEMDVVLTALEQQFCDLRTMTGMPADILLGIQKQCTNLNSSDQLSGPGQMQDLTGWNSTVNNWAQSFANLWQTVCDLRSGLAQVQDNCCDTDCAAIDMQIQATVLSETEIRLDFVGTVPANFIDGSPSSTIVLTDSAGGGPQTINNIPILASYFNPSTPYIITLGSGNSGANDITIQCTLRVEDPVEGLSCESLIQAIGLGTDTCPDLLITAVAWEEVTYSFTWNGPNTLIQVELYNQAQTMLLQSSVLSVLTGQTYSPQFLGLTSDTMYFIRLVINGEPCEFVEFTTLEIVCTAPTITSVDPDQSNPSGV
tara:strand:- start:3217 stop:4722 length:1506 start_codon:yes stop_codon:yes gene_type:complete